MCRNIRPLFNFDPPATEDEIRASALQFVRKVSGFSKPSHANAEAFERAVEEVTDAARCFPLKIEIFRPRPETMRDWRSPAVSAYSGGRSE